MLVLLLASITTPIHKYCDNLLRLIEHSHQQWPLRSCSLSTATRGYCHSCGSSSSPSVSPSVLRFSWLAWKTGISAMFPSNLPVSSHLSLIYLCWDQRLIISLVASTIMTFCLVSASFLLMSFPSLMTPLLFHQNYVIRPLVNTTRISMEVVHLTLWLFTCVYFVKKTEQYDFVHTKPGSAPIELWNMGIHLSIIVR